MINVHFEDSSWSMTRDFSSLRYFFFGAAPMSVEKLRRAFAVFGPVMMQGYGQMEAFASITALPPEEYFSDGELIERRLVDDLVKKLCLCANQTIPFISNMKIVFNAVVDVRGIS